MKTDFLVIGSGIAGLSYAIKVAKEFPKKKVVIICKTEAKETNTKYAQGGIAVFSDVLKDSPEKHINDTLKAGGKGCNKKVVEFVVREGPERLKELISYGVSFDITKLNSFDLAKEGGHSANRILHKGDYTGLEIERKLLTEVRKANNIQILQNTIAIDLITNEHLLEKQLPRLNSCYGVYILKSKTGAIEKIISKITVLATGGVGQVFEHTTNSETASGDGIAMAYRAKAEIKNMEFIQFHPTALYQPKISTDFLISEAVRGFGGVLRNRKGEAFMQKYDVRKELATRDVVSRAIVSELKRQNEPHVFLDCRHISKKDFQKHFPTIQTKCFNLGIDPNKKMIPVVPSAHYCCGGIVTDEYGKTTLENLYACGECACTGLHGSNRLASNSLLEALVFSHRCYVDTAKKIYKIKSKTCFKELKIGYKKNINSSIHKKWMNMSKKIMSKNFGIITKFANLAKGIELLQEIKTISHRSFQNFISPKTLELRNMLTVSLLILKNAKKRRNNAGVFYNLDLQILKHHEALET